MATTQQQTDLIDALADAQIASGATAAEFAAYLGALVAAADTAGLTAQEVGAIVSVGGITTKISAINAQIETKQDELDAGVTAKQAEIATLNNTKAAYQAALKAAVGG